ncbi:MAG: NAD(P)-dependent oxidoreductase [Gammaproteobacteria bacterium]|nr:NAD(P)-dependent oxidoreductase [Gammaproteobacteria bacterium]
MQKILFVGLGRMGSNMATHIAALPGYEVAVHNRSPEKITAWLKSNAGAAYSAGERYQVIALCIGNDEDVSGQLLEAGLLRQLEPQGVVIDHTTTSANLAHVMNKAVAEAGGHYLDAPVSGGEAGAVNGTLSCMVGGDESALQSVQPILQAYCANIVHIGESGAGQIAKMANQFCVAGVVAGLAEAVQLVKREGVDPDKVYQAISGGAAQSWQMDNRFANMVDDEFDFGFAIDHMIKDLGYAIEHAAAQGWQPQMVSMVNQWYQALSAEGRSTQDTSVLVKHYDSA